MNFQSASRLHESIRQVSKKWALRIEDEKSALDFYRLLYPQKRLLTKNSLASMFADEVGVLIDVVMDVLGACLPKMQCNSILPEGDGYSVCPSLEPHRQLSVLQVQDRWLLPLRLKNLHVVAL